ncbi:Nuclear envelope morphology protein [Aspergillus sp. HF37]|nr:Nuclear envelope morphology protein [Aspergillus sp. HF37]
MNSLNLLSSRVIGQSANPNRPRSRSQGDIPPRGHKVSSESGHSLHGIVPPTRGGLGKLRSYSEHSFHANDAIEKSCDGPSLPTEDVHPADQTLDEKTPLLPESEKPGAPVATVGFTRRIFHAVAETIKFILSTLAAPGVYAAQCFRDIDGRYSPITPVRKLRRSMAVSRSANNAAAPRRGTIGRANRRNSSPRKPRSQARESFASSTSESEGDRRGVRSLTGSRHRPSKSRSESPEKTEEDTPRRSIRIKLHNEEALDRQKQKRPQADSGQAPHNSVSLNPDSLKSPTSPSVHKITRYPHSPVPSRPLVPPRLPSYAAAAPRNIPQKTLVLDLDETLIHSLAKGGRMSSGHMVEVKLSTPMTTALTPGGPATALGPQHPILYYVHKRPHCDDFLRKVCKWFKLVVFTASVQEYADPVIDWLEQERKFFQARYYRQHCTFRNGAYIKDLSSVEPDLSKVMILDNSPMSYIFHEDNAIPIEGWINDPTDNGLLHLVPMLEALQYVTDVRALLALRRGESEG